jgi:hypothetical protein
MRHNQPRIRLKNRHPRVPIFIAGVVNFSVSKVVNFLIDMYMQLLDHIICLLD